MSGAPAAARPLTGSRVGIVICAVAGLVWWLAGAGSASNQPVWVLAGLAVAGVVAWSAKGVSDRSPEGGGPAGMELPEVRRRYAIVNLAQVTAIVLVVIGCLAADRMGLVMPLVAVVVGLHLVPFARWFGWRGYVGVGIGLVLSGIAGGAIELAGGEDGAVMLVTGGLCAIVLWIGGLGLGGAWRRRDEAEGGASA